MYLPRDVHVAEIGGNGTDVQLLQLCGGKESKQVNLQQGQTWPITNVIGDRKWWGVFGKVGDDKLKRTDWER